MGHHVYVDSVGGIIEFGLGKDGPFALPDSVVKWANSFDCNEVVYPFGFEVWE